MKNTKTLTPEMASLKAKLKATWTSGDFGLIAETYALGAAEFVNRLNLQPGERVLDVACGTGQDFVPNLLAQGRARAKAASLTIQFDENDAEALPYDDASFDTVMTMFGAMFTPRPEVTAAELVRTCRSGERIAMANWTPSGFIGQMFKIRVVPE